MIKNIFLDAGGVILNEDTHEKLRAEIISNLLNLNSLTYWQEEYWHDMEEAVFRFVPSVYNYVIWKNVRDEKVYKRIKCQYMDNWKEINPKLVLMDGIDNVLPVLSKQFKIGVLGQ